MTLRHLDSAVTDYTFGLLEGWLLEASVLFPNIAKLTDICDHITYGFETRLRPRERYVDLKKLDWSRIADREDEESIHGTFYVNNLRVSRSLIDWGDIMERHKECWSGEDEVWDRWEEWQTDNPDAKPSAIEFDWADLISAAEERLLLKDAALFEKKHNNGRWFSYYDKKNGVHSKDVPSLFFTPAARVNSAADDRDIA